jgi:hypothetical protein
MSLDEMKLRLLDNVEEKCSLQYAENPESDLDTRHSHLSPRTLLQIIICIALLMSTLLNILLWFTQVPGSEARLCVSEYSEKPSLAFAEILSAIQMEAQMLTAGLGLTTEKAYWQHTEYLSSNKSTSNALWDAIDTSPNTIALDADYIKKHKLDPSIPFPWDQSKGLYLIKAFHHMHCLVSSVDHHRRTYTY